MPQGADDCSKLFCKAAKLPNSPRCLFHAASAAREEYFAGLRPGADMNHRGTAFSVALLQSLSSATGPRVGNVNFEGASFRGPANFSKFTFEGQANFSGAHFRHGVSFREVRFEEAVNFDGATFLQNDQSNDRHYMYTLADNFAANFTLARFVKEVTFRRADFGVLCVTVPHIGKWVSTWIGFNEVVFGGAVIFDGSTIKATLRGRGATFKDKALFRSCEFHGPVEFNDAKFEWGLHLEASMFKTGGTFKNAKIYNGFHVEGAWAPYDWPVDLKGGFYEHRMLGFGDDLRGGGDYRR